MSHPAVKVHRAEGTGRPLVFDSPHSGEHYPDDFDHAPPRAVVRLAEDTHVARLYGGAPAFGATLIEAMFPRAYIDANRNVDEIDIGLLEDAWPGPVSASRKTQQGIGLVWRVARGGAPMYARKLTTHELRQRIEQWYLPYHAAIAGELNRMHARFGTVWHINCHSMPSIGDANADDPGRARADFVLGDRDGTTCAPEFTRAVADTLSAMGYRVAVNDPYKGVEIVRRYGRPREARHSLQIEVNRALYMDESTLVQNAYYAVLEQNLRSLMAALAAFVDANLASASTITGQTT